MTIRELALQYLMDDGVSMADMARTLGVSPQAISNLLVVRGDTPSIPATLLRLIDAYGYRLMLVPMPHDSRPDSAAMDA